MKEPGLFYEYAITPEVFGSAFLTENESNPVVITRLLHDICKNGMISDLHRRGWRRDIARRIGEIPSQKTRDRLMRLLKELNDRNRLVRHPKGSDYPNNSLEWLELARQAHDRAPLDAIMLTPELLKRSGMNDETLVEIDDDALNSQAWLARKQSKTIKQREEDYRCLLPKILRHAKQLYLIDPYFRPHRRWIDTIKICAELMGQRGGEPLQGRIEIHTGDPSKQECSPQDEAAEWKYRMKKIVLAPKFRHTLLVKMWRKSAGGERMHDRFLITDQVGFSVQGGLDCLPSRTSSDTIWTLMDEEERQHWLSKFTEGTSPYEEILTVPLVCK